MIANEYKELARWAMEQALKNGCQAAKVSLNQGSNASFELRDAKMDKLQQSTQSRMVLPYVDDRYGTTTNRLERGAGAVHRNGIEATRYLAKDGAGATGRGTLLQGGKPDLQLLTRRWCPAPDEKVAMAPKRGREAMGKDPRIISVGRRTAMATA